MKETGILMTPELYQATLDGRKTETRRLRGLKHVNKHPDDYYGVDHMGEDLWRLYGRKYVSDIKCPFSQVGDRLYVKEGLVKGQHKSVNDKTGVYRAYYASDHIQVPEWAVREWQWKGESLSPIFMPKLAARLWLEITGIRLERMRDITPKHCLLEGVEPQMEAFRWIVKGQQVVASNPIDCFAGGWDIINPDYRVQLNPLVWVVQYKRTKK